MLRHNRVCTRRSVGRCDCELYLSEEVSCMDDGQWSHSVQMAVESLFEFGQLHRFQGIEHGIDFPVDQFVSPFGGQVVPRFRFVGRFTRGANDEIDASPVHFDDGCFIREIETVQELPDRLVEQVIFNEFSHGRVSSRRFVGTASSHCNTLTRRSSHPSAAGSSCRGASLRRGAGWG